MTMRNPTTTRKFQPVDREPIHVALHKRAQRLADKGEIAKAREMFLRAERAQFAAIRAGK